MDHIYCIGLLYPCNLFSEQINFLFFYPCLYIVCGFKIFTGEDLLQLLNISSDSNLYRQLQVSSSL